MDDSSLRSFNGQHDQLSSSTSEQIPAYSMNAMNADEVDDLMDLFNVRIEDFQLSPGSFTHQYLEVGQDFELCVPPPQIPPMDGTLDDSLCRLDAQHTQHTFEFPATSGGPQQSNSSSPVIVGGPYPSSHAHLQGHHFGSSSPAPFTDASAFFHAQGPHFNHSVSQPPMQQYSSEMPSTPRKYSSPDTTYTSPHSPPPSFQHSSSSVGLQLNRFMPAMDSNAEMLSSSPLTGMRTITPSISLTTSPSAALPKSKNKIVIKNEDGSVIVYDPNSESLSFRCELCPQESFGRIHDLQRHQASRHVQEARWSCEFCQRPFMRRDALLRHLTTKSTREDGLHPMSHEVAKLTAARARAKLMG